ncbi:MlaD family protein [Prochlorococcus sp. MIT 1303]|uniref:MlaD family protein n=1 Tax=Prochlorococcus sp. MIT 1303 TaxID=1723647 RepID=UPI0007B3700C|nr:MlaD family protein [Prochlorococcus sp. MIT 1303]KZR62325.1 mce related protein [Prochlorococcus sp. MIT 1303]|tara:strand:+ start:77 stop:952 length:876 start_codon:yes stop_codon:yes gene_type:complete
MSMRRSVRDAIVGFSIVGAVVAFAGTLLWLRGVRLGAKVWSIKVNFPDATGLAERSPVTYRGILVGTVVKIDVTSQAVQATLEINKGDLRLSKPVVAKVASSSLLGGDSQVALVSLGKPLSANAPLPRSMDCSGSKVLCNGATIVGEPPVNISSVTETLDRLLQEAEKQKLVTYLVDSTKQIESTAEDVSKLMRQLKDELARAEPIISNLNLATGHINNVVEAFDNPKTVNDLKQTVSYARSLTAKFDAVGGDVEKLTNDPQFMNAVRSVTIGFGEFFNELYPAQTGGDRP